MKRVERDPSLEHQIVLTHRGVSCNCLYIDGAYPPMDQYNPPTVEQAWEQYENPKNHATPFDPAVWGRSAIRRQHTA